MNSVAWFKEMYELGKLSKDMYLDILIEEIKRKEISLKEMKEELERIS